MWLSSGPVCPKQGQQTCSPQHIFPVTYFLCNKDPYVRMYRKLTRFCDHLLHGGIFVIVSINQHKTFPLMRVFVKCIFHMCGNKYDPVFKTLLLGLSGKHSGSRSGMIFSFTKYNFYYCRFFFCHSHNFWALHSCWDRPLADKSPKYSQSWEQYLAANYGSSAILGAA